MSAVSHQEYDYDIVKVCVVLSIVLGLVGTFFGTFIASQLAWPALNFDSPYLSFGRFRPMHTNTVIFAFGGYMLYASAFYIVQRTCHVRIWSSTLAWVAIWLWLIGLVCALVTYPLGITQGKEYHEAEWWIDIILAVSWVLYSL